MWQHQHERPAARRLEAGNEDGSASSETLAANKHHQARKSLKASWHGGVAAKKPAATSNNGVCA